MSLPVSNGMPSSQTTAAIQAGGEVATSQRQQPPPLPAGSASFSGLTSTVLNPAIPTFNPYARHGTFQSSSGSGSLFTRPSNLLHPTNNESLSVGVIRPISRPETSVGTVGSNTVTSSSQPQQSENLSSASNLVGSGQRLKVEDALSYLDQVKVVFAARAQVYSDFLDIMKDFKSQAIDTPGVIQRVSSLFRGHPSLIVGFNTFLPPGYRIDVDSSGERVSICTPSGQSHIIASGTEASTKGEAGGLGSSQSGSQLGVDSLAGHQRNLSPRPAGAPIEFNHAINYVNKIKGRFQHRPEVYKQFLEILHSYQKEQRDLKSGTVSLSHKPLTESAVYASVARLFSNEEDLLCEFSQFLPDATGSGMFSSLQSQLSAAGIATTTPLASPSSSSVDDRSVSQNQVQLTGQLGSPKVSSAPSVSSKKLTPGFRTDSTATPPKKAKRSPAVDIVYPVSFSEAAKYGTLSEYQFFDKVRKALKSDEVYENFLRCLVLFNHELISKAELLELVQPFLGKYPELFKWMKDFMGCNERSGYVDTISQSMAQQERISSDLAIEIDYASCKRFGVSYRALPDSYLRPKCGGRTDLCDSVLNDTWVSFPSWSSEDSSYVSSKKSQYEEFIYRTEDERFELDIVIEVNRSAIQALECVRRRLARMSSEEAKKFRLDETLGGRSAPLMSRAIKRIYGEKFTDIIDGLRRNPSVAVPVVLKRLKAKDEEWREAQKGFNRIWREQNEKYYLKSLDHQAIAFKQNDLKFIRSKALLNQIEVLYDERHEKMEDGITNIPTGPHMTIKYPLLCSIFYDVNDLLIHHVKRQTGIQKEEKSKIKKLLRQKLPDLFGLRREDLSDDEDEKTDGGSTVLDENETKDDRRQRLVRSSRLSDDAVKLNEVNPIPSECMGEPKVSCGYALLFSPNPWYVFLRLHQLLCERLAKLKQDAELFAKEKEELPGKPKSVAAQLKCEPKLPCPPTQYYACLLNQIKNLLDAQIDSSQFEDNLRDMFATAAFIAFTADKLVQNMVRQLQQMATEELSFHCLELHNKWRSAGGAGGLAYCSVNRQIQEEAYQAESEQILADKNAFKIYFMHDEGKITFELLDTDSCEEDTGEPREWSLYIQDFLHSLPRALVDSFSESQLKQLSKKPVFLSRNIRQVKKVNKIMVGEEAEENEMDKSVDSVVFEPTADSRYESGNVARSSSSKGHTSRKILAHEDMEIHLIPGHWGLRFVANTSDLLWKKGAVSQSRMRHGYVSRKRRTRFLRFQQKWLERNTSELDQKDCLSWLEGTNKLSARHLGIYSDEFSYLTFIKYSTDFKLLSAEISS